MPLTRVRLAASRMRSIALMLLLGCASRDVPTRYPESSAASLDAPTGGSLVVTRALAADPPLPGTHADGWQGLEDDSQTAEEAAGTPRHNHLGDHHGH